MPVFNVSNLTFMLVRFDNCFAKISVKVAQFGNPSSLDKLIDLYEIYEV
jgi:hypothetical protein